MGRVTECTMALKAIKAELVQCERKSWRLDQRLQSPRLTKEYKRELSRQRAELQSRSLALLNEMYGFGKAGPNEATVVQAP